MSWSADFFSTRDEVKEGILGLSNQVKWVFSWKNLYDFKILL